jgi:hypothetical protein
MDNLEKFPLPLGNVDVPINKIVRCRWRDEEDYEEKVKDAVERIGEQGFRYNLQGRRLDSVEDWIEYLMVADCEVYPTRELAEAKALTMPLDMVEQWVGHNRKEGCRQLGTWYIWSRENEGMRDVIPFVLKDVSKEEAQNIYLSDNRKNDHQSAGWALGNVRKMLPDLISSGMVKSEANAHLAKQMGLSVKAIEKLVEINKGLVEGVVSPAIKRLRPDDAVEFWKLLVGITVHVPVTFERQKEIITDSFDSVNPRKSIGNAFSDLRAALPQLPKLVVEKTRKSPDQVALQTAHKLATILQNEDLEDETKQRINEEYVPLIAKLTTTVLTEDDIEDNEILAEMEEAETQQETHDDQTAVY